MLNRISTLLFVAVSVASASGQTRFSTLAGSVTDQTGKVLPDAVVTMSDAAAKSKHEVRTDRNGRFEVGGLTPAKYTLEVKVMGFSPYTETITVEGQDVERSIQLQLGSLSETITVNDRPAEPPSPDQQERNRQSREAAEAFYQRALARCGGGDPAPVGGNILVPKKLVDVRPNYPQSAKQAGAAGTVKMEATIGTDGLVRTVNVTSAPHPDLGRAAADAVRQWEFSPTLLNCTPVEVRMNVTTNFVAQ